jgi:hypothetical protein
MVLGPIPARWSAEINRQAFILVDNFLSRVLLLADLPAVLAAV